MQAAAIQVVARKRRWLGTLLGIKGKLAAGVGDAISIDGFGLRANMEVDWDAPGGVTLMAGAKVRSITEDFGGHTRSAFSSHEQDIATQCLINVK